jgi:hypothetical protein
MSPEPPVQKTTLFSEKRVSTIVLNIFYHLSARRYTKDAFLPDLAHEI